MLNFANAKAATSVIPAGTLVEARLVVEELRTSAAGNHYLNLRAEITAPATFAGRKIWTNLMLTQSGGLEPSSVGSAQIKATLEVNGHDPETDPDAFAFADSAAVARALTGATAALRLGLKDTPGGGQRTVVKYFLSPNPGSGTRTLHEQLKASLCEEASPWPPAAPTAADLPPL